MLVSELSLAGDIPVPFNNGGHLALNAAAVDSLRGFAYFGLWADPGIILKFDLHQTAPATTTIFLPTEEGEGQQVQTSQIVKNESSK